MSTSAELKKKKTRNAETGKMLEEQEKRENGWFTKEIFIFDSFLKTAFAAEFILLISHWLDTFFFKHACNKVFKKYDKVLREARTIAF